MSSTTSDFAPARTWPRARALYFLVTLCGHVLTSILYMFPTMQFGPVGLVLGILVSSTLSIFQGTRLLAVLHHEALPFLFNNRWGSFVLVLLCALWEVYLGLGVFLSVVFVVAVPVVAKEGGGTEGASPLVTGLYNTVTVTSLLLMASLMGYLLVTALKAFWRVIRPTQRVDQWSQGVPLADVEAYGLLSDSDEDKDS